MEFQLVLIHENQQLKTNINEMFEKCLQISMVGPVLLGTAGSPN